MYTFCKTGNKKKSWKKMYRFYTKHRNVVDVAFYLTLKVICLIFLPNTSYINIYLIKDGYLWIKMTKKKHFVKMSKKLHYMPK